jgi:hypothetical protein
MMDYAAFLSYFINLSAEVAEKSNPRSPAPVHLYEYRIIDSYGFPMGEHVGLQLFAGRVRRVGNDFQWQTRRGIKTHFQLTALFDILDWDLHTNFLPGIREIQIFRSTFF